jgi:2-methylcitrate dehydratase PrpD
LLSITFPDFLAAHKSVINEASAATTADTSLPGEYFLAILPRDCPNCQSIKQQISGRYKVICRIGLAETRQEARHMPQKGGASASEALANFVSTASWQDVAVQSHEAKRSILNFFATALGSAYDPAVTDALSVLAPFSGAPTSGIIGRGERMDAPCAAFLNAVSANLLDYDDTHLQTVIHPTAPVAPPLLALAEARGNSGRDVLTAFVLGVEVECRAGNAVSPGHYARGWHITATCGVLGSAAACAKLLGLPPEKIANAIGIAASQSAGLVENLASGAKNVGVGNAGKNGLFAALLAQQGYTAAPRSIEGALGWARAMGDQPKMEALTGGLGKSWELAKNAYKPYPAGIVFHAIIDACLNLRSRLNGNISGIVSVTVQGSRLLLARGDRTVLNERDARVSIHHSAAVALLFGGAGVKEFSSAVVFQPEAVTMRQKVRAELDDSLPDGAARVTIRTAPGDVLSETVMSARGSLERPLSDSALEAKLRDCGCSNRAGWDAEEIIATVWRLDTLPDVRALMRPASNPSHRSPP